MTAKMKFSMEITDEALWYYILCLEDRLKNGNNNTRMKAFLDTELPRLHKIHDRWAKFASLKNDGVKVTSVSV